MTTPRPAPKRPWQPPCAYCKRTNITLLRWVSGRHTCFPCLREKDPLSYQNILSWFAANPLGLPSAPDEQQPTPQEP